MSYSVLVIDWDKIEANNDVVFQRVVIAGKPLEFGTPLRLKRGENIRVEWGVDEKAALDPGREGCDS